MSEGARPFPLKVFDTKIVEKLFILPFQIITKSDEEVVAPIKRKRGRPKKILPFTIEKKKTLSDNTKKKIAENSKKFSICKLCKKQCKGFRGLVDHMHNDHSDYKPWQCNYCEVKTSFAKTLYKHLKQVHKVCSYYLHKCLCSA